MAAKLYQFPQTASFSFEKDASGEYNLVPGEILQSYYYKIMRGADVGPFIIKCYCGDNKKPYIIDDGVIVPMTQEEEIELNYYGRRKVFAKILLNHDCTINKLTRTKKKLDIAIDQAYGNAPFFLRKKFVYQQHTDDGFDIITLKVNDDYISCGWYDYSRTDRLGLEMSAFMLYAFGCVNAEDERHRELWRICQNILPYSSELRDVDVADRIILDGLRDLVLSGRKPTSFEDKRSR